MLENILGTPPPEPPANVPSLESQDNKAIDLTKFSLRTRMEAAGVVELAPEHVEGARQLRQHVEAVRECWRVWLAFGTGV